VKPDAAAVGWLLASKRATRRAAALPLQPADILGICLFYERAREWDGGEKRRVTTVRRPSIVHCAKSVGAPGRYMFVRFFLVENVESAPPLPGGGALSTFSRWIAKVCVNAPPRLVTFSTLAPCVSVKNHCMRDRFLSDTLGM
jgi:hypothetical protein